MRRVLIAVSISLALVGVLLVVFVAWALQNETFLKNQLVDIVHEQTGRTLTLSGPLEISPGRKTRIVARGIALENAAWGERPDMLEVGLLRLVVDAPSLLGERVRIDELVIEDCQVELRENDEGQSNWTMGPDDAPDATDDEGGVLLLHLAIDRCALSADGPRFQQPLKLRIDRARLQPGPNDRIEGSVAGRVNEDELAVEGWMGPLAALTAGGELRHELSLRSGAVRLESKGSIADAASGSGPDLDVRLSGPDIRTVLTRYGLPVFSEGAFDFHARLRQQDDLARLDIDGDLGNLELEATGEFDRLKSPTRAWLRAGLAGPDLAALGEALGVANPVASPFESQVSLRLDGEKLTVEKARLTAAGDHIALSGSMPVGTSFAGAAFELAAHSDALGHWLPPTASQGTNELHALADLPFDITGRLRHEKARWFGEALHVRLGPHRMQLDGSLHTGGRLDGSHVNITFETPDLSALGPLLGLSDLPTEPLELQGSIEAVGEGARFSVTQVEAGALRLEGKGHVADLDTPLGLDLEFALTLPGLSVLDRWLPGLSWPDGDVAARGSLKNLGDRVEIEEAVVTLGADELRWQGEIGLEEGHPFELAVEASVPDLSRWRELAAYPLPAVNARLETRLEGDPNNFRVGDLELQAGDSRLGGELTVSRSKRMRIDGELTSPRIDLDPWIAADQDSSANEAADSKQTLVFDATPVVKLGELGFDVAVVLSVAQASVFNAAYSDIEIDLRLADRRLLVKPFSLRGVYGGRFTGALDYDQGGALPELDIELEADNMSMVLGALEGQDPSTLPRSSLHFSLHGTGRTHHEMAASTDGRVLLEVGAGQLAASNYSFLVNDFVAELFKTLNPFYKTREFTQLDCAVAAAEIESGQVLLEPVVLHTEQLTVISQGTIDLETERLDVTFNSKQRKGLGISATDLVNPFIKVGGTLAKPSLELDPAGTVVKGGIAVATAGLSILANSLAERFLSSKDPCGDALRQIEKGDAERR